MAQQLILRGESLFQEVALAAHRTCISTEVLRPPSRKVQHERRRKGWRSRSATAKMGSGALTSTEPAVLAPERPTEAEHAICPHCFRAGCNCAESNPQSHKFLAALQRPDVVEVMSALDAQGVRFPAVAAKLALRIGLEERGTDLNELVSSLVVPSQWSDATDGTQLPAEWQELYGQLEPILRRVLGPSGFNPMWFAGVMGRLHLNAMSTGDRTTALFALSSFFNHSCRPNISPRFDGAEVTWVAETDIQPEEECFISYRTIGMADDEPEAARDEWLHWNYGFRCQETCSCGRFDSADGLLG